MLCFRELTNDSRKYPDIRFANILSKLYESDSRNISELVLATWGLAEHALLLCAKGVSSKVVHLLDGTVRRGAVKYE
eukprot:2857772-Amphidinium_carterae.1